MNIYPRCWPQVNSVLQKFAGYWWKKKWAGSLMLFNTRPTVKKLWKNTTVKMPNVCVLKANSLKENLWHSEQSFKSLVNIPPNEKVLQKRTESKKNGKN